MAFISKNPGAAAAQAQVRPVITGAAAATLQHLSSLAGISVSDLIEELLVAAHKHGLELESGTIEPGSAMIGVGEGSPVQAPAQVIPPATTQSGKESLLKSFKEKMESPQASE